MDEASRFSEHDLLTLWGKTKNRDPNATENQYHPLLFHLLDVGNSALALWQVMPPRFQGRIAAALGVSQEEAERVVVLLAGIHDLGKASAFQAKAHLLWARVQSVGLRLATPQHAAHGWVTASGPVLPRLLTEAETCGWAVDEKRLANTLANITGAHHGKFLTNAGWIPSTDTLGDATWHEARIALAREMAKALHVGRTEERMPSPVRLTGKAVTDCGVGAYLTGLIAVADWIGSAARHFFLEPHRSVADYTPVSHARAEKAVEDFGWLPPSLAGLLPFEQIVWGRSETGKEIRFAPNDMQAKAVGFVDAAAGRPYLMIIEAAMGDGKTEAALYAIDKGMTSGANHGFYDALPTQATGNAMFERVLSYLRERGHTGLLNLQLVHGGADFNPDYEALRQEAEEQAANGPIMGDEDMRLVAQSWFATRKQALLAPFGVGTIDQGLMGVLQTRHWFVRLFGLAGKVVVFDEVHAYDVYMGELLETLIAWLAELDCTVILLSATLPRDRRERLTRAYRRDATVEDKPYPRVTFVPKEGDGAACQGVPVTETPRAVSLSFAPASLGKTLAERIFEDMPNGGCAAVICNTVAQAQSMFEALHSDPTLSAAGWKVSLFHARMPLLWRQWREGDVLERFGKKSTPEQRDRQILIATQVVEQSLDLDFDWMASEMAPVDLLLQRLGRLWRHKARTESGRRPVAAPKFVVMLGSLAVDSAGDAPPLFPPGSDLVYEKYVLLRSYLALRDRDMIVLPYDIETLVNEVYDTAGPDNLNDRWREALNAAQDRRDRNHAKQAKIAEQNRIAPPPPRGDFSMVIRGQQKDLKEDDDPTTHETLRAVTRLGDPSVTLICLRQESNGRLYPFCAESVEGAEVDVASTSELSPAQVRALRESGVAVARPKPLFFALIDKQVPPGWRENSHLRYARHAVFIDGRSTVETSKGSLTLLLDAERGLRVEKEQAIDEAVDKQTNG